MGGDKVRSATAGRRFHSGSPRRFGHPSPIREAFTWKTGQRAQAQAIAGRSHHRPIEAGKAAKAGVSGLLQSFGWRDIVDPGGIATARGTGIYLPLQARVWMTTKNPRFTIRLVRQPKGERKRT
jgi:hypothetical protein